MINNLKDTFFFTLFAVLKFHIATAFSLFIYILKRKTAYLHLIYYIETL